MALFAGHCKQAAAQGWHDNARCAIKAAMLRTLCALALMAACLAPAAAREPLPPGFVYLADVAPSVLQDMRYATPDNFTGRPLPGYGAGACVLRRDAALALARVAADLAPRNLALKTYDCYRPVRAVRAFMRWAGDGRDDPATRRFYPQLRKRELFARGFIAARSRHSQGIAVDLTLVALPAAAQPPFDPAAPYAACTAPAASRAPDNGLDMGTGFDCFDARSATASRAVPAPARAHRALLTAAMRRHGFKNYFREWWHFEYESPAPRRAYDVPLSSP